MLMRDIPAISQNCLLCRVLKGVGPFLYRNDLSLAVRIKHVFGPFTLLVFLAFMAGALTLGASFYLEFGASLRPCFLCQIQRAFLAAFTLINLVAAIHSSSRSTYSCTG